MESQDDGLMDKVVVFLVVAVSAILIFTQYQFYSISHNYLSYISAALIIALAGLIAWMIVTKPYHPAAHAGHYHAAHASNKWHFDFFRSEPKPLTQMDKVTYALVAVAAFMILFNQVQLSQANALAGLGSGLALKSSSTKTSLALTGDPMQDAMAVVIPRGTPFYGESLGVSFDDPIRSLEVIAQLDPSYGRNRIQLQTPEERQRYISILTTPYITCEFCCGVKTAVTNDGRPTCGCKHSWAMRGLTAYLIKNYPDVSDAQITKEVARWKGLFFPKQMIQRYVEETQTGQYTQDIAALLLDVDEEKLKEMKAAVASGGNAQSSGDAAASLNDLPSMVGGC